MKETQQSQQKKSQVFSTAADNQPGVDIHVLQGEREFAKDNKTLGRFQLNDIPPAPRGVPQIEVTFDIDANGIVSVSAKDLGTNKSQSITITASSNLTEDEINKAVEEAKAHAEEDKKQKEYVDTKNGAENLILSLEKMLKENGDKISAEDKEKLEKAIEECKKECESTETETIKNAIDKLSKESNEVVTKLYQAAAEQAKAQEEQSKNKNKDDEVVVDDDDDKKNK